MEKHLIVYFSQSGNCEKIAKTLAEKTGADVERILPVQPYGGKFPLRGMLDFFLKKRPAIRSPKLDCATYENVVFVFPIWAEGIPPHACTYLDQNVSKIRAAYTVCASASSGDAGVLKQFRETYKLEPRGGLVIHNAELADKTFVKKLENFAVKL